MVSDFGFGSLGLRSNDFSDPENIIQLGYEPYRIDLLMDVTGLDFSSSFVNKEVVDIEGVQVNFVNLDDLIKAKRSLGRSQDLADAEKLKAKKTK